MCCTVGQQQTLGGAELVFLSYNSPQLKAGCLTKYSRTEYDSRVQHNTKTTTVCTHLLDLPSLKILHSFPNFFPRRRRHVAIYLLRFPNSPRLRGHGNHGNDCGRQSNLSHDTMNKTWAGGFPVGAAGEKPATAEISIPSLFFVFKSHTFQHMYTIMLPFPTWRYQNKN